MEFALVFLRVRYIFGDTIMLHLNMAHEISFFRYLSTIWVYWDLTDYECQTCVIFCEKHWNMTHQARSQRGGLWDKSPLKRKISLNFFIQKFWLSPPRKILATPLWHTIKFLWIFLRSSISVFSCIVTLS
jgi:hypothetical protein